MHNIWQHVNVITNYLNEVGIGTLPTVATQQARGETNTPVNLQLHKATLVKEWGTKGFQLKKQHAKMNVGDDTSKRKYQIKLKKKI